ncbi:MAG: hypothetical protein HY396_01270 [Candidatus Doudnabacteria bacterium]|nr:hypothetical protein [Candidatus Doudnabacteria bacterium]
METALQLAIIFLSVCATIKLLRKRRSEWESQPRLEPITLEAVVEALKQDLRPDESKISHYPSDRGFLRYLSNGKVQVSYTSTFFRDKDAENFTFSMPDRSRRVIIRLENGQVTSFVDGYSVRSHPVLSLEEQRLVSLAVGRVQSAVLDRSVQ